MKIVVTTGNYELVNSLVREGKKYDLKVIPYKTAELIMNSVYENDTVGIVITGHNKNSQKLIDDIKIEAPHLPVLAMVSHISKNIVSADMKMWYEPSLDIEEYAKCIIHNVFAFNRTFGLLKKFTGTSDDVIKFKDLEYDSARKLISGKDGKNLSISTTTNAVIRVLSLNFNKVLNKKMILEAVWGEANYFTMRSLDVYLHKIRKILREYSDHMVITSIKDVGIVLEYKKDGKYGKPRTQ